MLNNEQEIRDFLLQFRELTKEQQEQIYWFVSHMEIFDLMLQTDCLTEKEADAWIQQAVEKRDYVLMSLIQYKQIKERRCLEQQ